MFVGFPSEKSFFKSRHNAGIHRHVLWKCEKNSDLSQTLLFCLLPTEKVATCIDLLSTLTLQNGLAWGAVLTPGPAARLGEGTGSHHSTRAGHLLPVTPALPGRSSLDHGGGVVSSYQMLFQEGHGPQPGSPALWIVFTLVCV